MDSRLHERTPTPGESLTLSIDGRPLEEKTVDEETEASPVTPTSNVDDYPDGGLAAWLVVVGVSP